MKRIPVLLIFFIFFLAHDLVAQMWHAHRNGIPVGNPWGGNTTNVLGDGTNIYAANLSDYTDSGMYFVANGTDSFSRAACTGLAHGNRPSLIKYAGKIFLGSSSGVSYSADSGHTWHSAPAQPGLNPMITCLFASNDTLYAGVTDSGIYRTTDSANSWVHLGNTGLDTLVYQILPINGRIFSGGFLKLQYTTDDGVTWITVPPLPGMGSFWWPGNGLLSKDTTIYVASGNGLFKSNDYGTTWIPLIPDYNIVAMMFVDSFMLVNISWPTNKVEISNDDGSSFVLLDSGLHLGLGSGVRNFSYNDDYVMLGVLSGCPCIDSTVYVIGRSDLPLAFSPGLQVYNTLEASAKYNIYPNPATDKLTIDYSGYNNWSISCTISDLAGRTIDQFNFSGAHTEIPLDNISPGVYILRLTDGINVITHKLVISK